MHIDQSRTKSQHDASSCVRPSWASHSFSMQHEPSRAPTSRSTPRHLNIDAVATNANMDTNREKPSHIEHKSVSTRCELQATPDVQRTFSSKHRVAQHHKTDVCSTRILHSGSGPPQHGRQCSDSHEPRVCATKHHHRMCMYTSGSPHASVPLNLAMNDEQLQAKQATFSSEHRAVQHRISSDVRPTCHTFGRPSVPLNHATYVENELSTPINSQSSDDTGSARRVSRDRNKPTCLRSAKSYGHVCIRSVSNFNICDSAVSMHTIHVLR